MSQPCEFDRFLGDEVIDLYGIEVSKLELFKKCFPVDYEGMKAIFEKPTLRLVPFELVNP